MKTIEYLAFVLALALTVAAVWMACTTAFEAKQESVKGTSYLPETQ